MGGGGGYPYRFKTCQGLASAWANSEAAFLGAPEREHNGLRCDLSVKRRFIPGSDSLKKVASGS